MDATHAEGAGHSRRTEAGGIPPLGVAALSGAFVVGLVALGSAASGGHAPVAAGLAILAVLLVGAFATIWGIAPSAEPGPADARTRRVGTLRIWIAIAGIVAPVCVMAGWLPPAFTVTTLATMAIAGALR